MRGAFKPLLPLGGRPVVAQVLHALKSDARIDPLLVVTGFRSDQVRSALAGTGVTFVYNEAHEQGEMLSSVRAGIRALPQDAQAFVVALGDQPGVLPLTIRLLVDAWQRAPGAIVVPVYQGQRGHPIVFPSRCIAKIEALATDQTLKAVTHRQGQNVVQVFVDDPAVRMDIDTPQDYQDAVRRWDQKPAAPIGSEALHGSSPG